MEKLESAKRLRIWCVRCNKVIPLPYSLLYRTGRPMTVSNANKLDENLHTCGGEISHEIIMGEINADLFKPDDAETWT